MTYRRNTRNDRDRLLWLILTALIGAALVTAAYFLPGAALAQENAVPWPLVDVNVPQKDLEAVVFTRAREGTFQVIAEPDGEYTVITMILPRPERKGNVSK